VPPRGREERLDRELRFHIDERVRALVARGVGEQEARRLAHLEFGGVEAVKDACRDVRGDAWLADAGRDLRYAVRSLRRSPGFAAVAILTLALGTGADTAVFALVHRVLVAALPVAQPEQLFVAARRPPESGGPAGWPHTAVRELEASDVFAGVIARGGSERVTVGTPAGGEPARGELVSGGYFEVLGVRPHLGRLLARSDDVAPGAHPVVVLSHRYWQRRFGGDPAVVGTVLQLGGLPMTVVGVSPPGFDGLDPGQAVDLRVPLSMYAQLRRIAPRPQGPSDLDVVARVAPGTALPAAEERAGAVLRRALEALAPSAARGAAERVELLPAARGFGRTRQQLRTALLVSLSITAAVLLAACLNLTNLLLARTAARHRELAVRRALGAGRGRIARQLLVESVLLASCGGLVGAFLAAVATPALLRFASGGVLHLDQQAGASAGVVAFHVATSVLCGLLIGSAQIAAARRERPASARGRTLLVAAQVALSVVVLAAAGLFVQTVRALRGADLGFRADGLLVMALSPQNAGRPDAEALPFFRAVRERVEALPGVEGATLGTVRALSGSTWRAAVTTDGGAPADAPPAWRDAVGPGYFRTLGMPLVEGRDFTPDDVRSAPRVAIVNESFARFYFPGQEVLGRRIGVAAADHTIVGVTRDAKYAQVRESTPRFWYVPYEQQPNVKYLDLYVRTAGDPERLGAAVRAAIASVDREVALFDVRTQRAQVEEALLPERMLATLAAAFATATAGLAALGLYGVLAFVARQRRREIGIRVALGARRATVVGLVVRDTALFVALGLLAGVPAAAALGRYARGVLFGVSPLDPASLAGAALAMAVVAACAAAPPAWRAARADPMAALREP
jgi:predicted permease